ncbi:MAG: PqqD family protein [Myxococcota bacterium]
MLSIDDRIAVVGGHIERRVGPLCFVLAPDGQMHSFDNATAVEIWDLLAAASDTGTTVRELAAALSERFEVDPETAVADVQPVVQALLSHCVVQRVG